MSRFKDSGVALTISFFLLLCGLTATRAIAWENMLTHPAITKKATERSVLAGDYLKTQLGLNSDLNTPLELTGQFQNNIDVRVAQQPHFNWNKTKISIKEWLMEGSKLEDIPGPRARHHFYDPIRDTGLDNPGLVAEVLNLSKLLYPAYWPFDATGASTLDRARSTEGYRQNEYLNYGNCKIYRF